MKKLLSLVLSGVMLLQTLPAVFAETGSDLTLSVGDKVQIGIYKGEPVEYEVMGNRDVDGDGIDELFLASSKIVSFRAFNQTKSSSYAVNWKSDHKGTPNTLRTWLNSDAAEGEVEYNLSDGDTTVVYANEAGFMNGMDDFEKSRIVEVTHKALASNDGLAGGVFDVIDGGSGVYNTWNTGGHKTFAQNYPTNTYGINYDDASYVLTTDKVFIPSLADIYDFFGEANPESKMNVGATEIAKTEASSASDYNSSVTFIRDTYFTENNMGQAKVLRWVSYNTINNGVTTGSVAGVRPCMYIKSDTVVEETSAGSGIYQFRLPVRANFGVTQNGEEISEVKQGEIKILGGARTSVDAHIIGVVIKVEDGKEIMEDYIKSPISDNIDLSLNSVGDGDRYVAVFIWDNDNKCITNAVFAGDASAVLWNEADVVDELTAETAVEGNSIKVSGVASTADGKNLSIVAKKRNTEKVVYTNQLTIPQNKGFEFTFTVENFFGEGEAPIVEGWYDIVLTTDSYCKTVSAGIAGEGIWINLLEKINEKDTEFVTNSFLNTEGYDVVYNSITDKGFFLDEYKDNTVILDEAIAELFANKPSSGYTEENIDDCFNKYLTNAYFDNAEATEKIGIVENEKYAAILDVDGITKLKSYKVAKEDADELFEGVTSENVAEKLYENIVLLAISKAENSTDVKAVIEENADVIGIKFGSKYEKLSTANIKKLYDNFLGKNFNDIDAVAEIFEKAYDKVTEVSASGGGSSGGSSGSGAISSVASITKKPEVPKNHESVEKTGFADVENLTWGKDAILYLAEKQIISGISDSKFAPDDNITREEFAKIAVLAFGINAKGGMPFADVAEDAWYAEYVQTLAASGFVKGISETMFGVGNNITRQDLAVIIYRILEAKDMVEKNSELSFADAERIAEYAREAIATLNLMGFVNGYDDNTFRGDSFVTRREAAQIIYNIIGGAK